MLIGVDARDPEDHRECHHDGCAADRQGYGRRDEGPEDDDQRDRCQRQRDQLGSAQVRFRHCLDVAVEGGSAGQCDVDPVGMAEARFDDRNGFRRVVGREVQEHHVVGGRAGRPIPVARRGCAGSRARRAVPTPRPRSPRRQPPRMPGRPARSDALWYTTARADGGRPSSDSRRCRAWADGRLSLLKPPDCSAPPALGANGSASSRRTAQPATTHQRRRSANRPSRAKRLMPSLRRARRIGRGDVGARRDRSPAALERRSARSRRRPRAVRPTRAASTSGRGRRAARRR